MVIINIPKQFTIHGHNITVVIKEIDNIDDDRYGYYDCVKEEIVLFANVRSNREPIKLTETQLEASFWHELFHLFQWHIKGETDEWESQSYSGLMVEFFKTSNLKIVNNE